MGCWIDGLKGWQDLAAGGLAVLAALGVAAVVESRERGRISRQQAAARAVLPLALSTVVEYAERCARSMVALRMSAVNQRIPASVAAAYDPPILDSSVISELRDLVENADPKIGDRVTRLISEIQIFAARLRAIPINFAPGTSSILVLSNVNTYTVQAAVIYARGGGMFLYARRAEKPVPPEFPSEKSVVEALNLMGFDEDEDADAELYSCASRYPEWRAP